MRMHKAIVLLGLATILAWGTAADDSGGMKIGIVDLQQALLSSDEGKSAKSEMERKQKEAEGQLQPMIDRLKAIDEELKSKKFVLSEEALYQKQLDAVQLKGEIDTRMKELDGKMKVDGERLLGPMRKKLVDAITAIGKEQGFTLILTKDAPGLAYSREALDITDLVIQRFNKKG
jgi:outer membrane protein